MNRPDLIEQLEKLTPSNGFISFTAFNSSEDDDTLVQLAPTMRIEILKMSKEIEELREQLKSTNRKVKFCSASINGALDGLELDNDCDVIEKSTVIEQLKVQLEILTNEQSRII